MTIPFYPLSPPPTPETTQVIDITFGPNKTGNLEWYMNNVSFHANYEYVSPCALLPSINASQSPSPPPRKPRQYILPQLTRLERLQFRLQLLHPSSHPQLYRLAPLLAPNAPARPRFLDRSRRRR